MLETIIPAFLMGLGGSLHCVGMCGGIVTALSISTPSSSFARSSLMVVHHNLGRLLTYLLLGMIGGLMGTMISDAGALNYLRVIAGGLLILVGLYLFNIWNGVLYLERLGQSTWKKIAPLLKRIQPGKSPLHALTAGMLWGFIPCGLLYSALAIAIAQGSVDRAILFMLFFALGTSGPMLLMGIGFSSITQWMKKKPVKLFIAASVIVMGCWTVWSVFQHDHSGHAGHTGHEHHGVEDPSEEQSDAHNHNHHHH